MLDINIGELSLLSHYRRQHNRFYVVGQPVLIELFGGHVLHDRKRAIRDVVRDAQAGKVDPDDVDEKFFSKRLYTADLPDPDLVLRTSGEERISNFLLWQLAYSELYFVDVYWPGFRKIDFLRALRSYQMRQRRYGE